MFHLGASSAVLSLAVLLARILSCHARSWVDLVDQEIFRPTNLDPFRLEIYEEADPFKNRQQETEPTSQLPQSISPVLAPTLHPSSRLDNVMDNGGCGSGQFLHELRMRDAWGDGWHGNEIVITVISTYSDFNHTRTNETGWLVSEEQNRKFTLTGEAASTPGTGNSSNDTETEAQSDIDYSDELFRGSLNNGAVEYAYICLEPLTCYRVDIGGGNFSEEIRWDIASVRLGLSEAEREEDIPVTVAKGLAPFHCQFSIPDPASGRPYCPNTCHPVYERDTPQPTKSPTAAPATKEPVPAPVPAPVPVQVPSPVQQPLAVQTSSTFAPVVVSQQRNGASAVPSDMPSLLPSFVPTSAPIQPPTKIPVGTVNTITITGGNNTTAGRFAGLGRTNSSNTTTLPRLPNGKDRSDDVATVTMPTASQSNDTDVATVNIPSTTSKSNTNASNGLRATLPEPTELNTTTLTANVPTAGSGEQKGNRGKKGAHPRNVPGNSGRKGARGGSHPRNFAANATGHIDRSSFSDLL
jgi:hypothetical protein